MLHLLILAWPVLVPACSRICCRRPRTALGARPSRGQVGPGEERASADVQMSCPGLLEEEQHGYVLRPLARHQRRVRRYEPTCGATSAACTTKTGPTPAPGLTAPRPFRPSSTSTSTDAPTPVRGPNPAPGLAAPRPSRSRATSLHTSSPRFTRETSPTSARPTSPSARRRTRPSVRCWTTSPPATMVSRGGSARMPSVGTGSTAALPGRCMCRRRTRGRRGRVRSSGVMC